MQVRLGVVEQVHPAPVMAVAVRPDGSVSVIVTVPLVGLPPEFVAVIVKLPVPPWVKLPACDFVTVRSGEVTMVAESVAESFEVFVSPPPETCTVLVSGVAAFEATATVRVMAG